MYIITTKVFKTFSQFKYCTFKNVMRYDAILFYKQQQNRKNRLRTYLLNKFNKIIFECSCSEI